MTITLLSNKLKRLPQWSWQVGVVGRMWMQESTVYLSFKTKTPLTWCRRCVKTTQVHRLMGQLKFHRLIRSRRGWALIKANKNPTPCRPSRRCKRSWEVQALITRVIELSNRKTVLESKWWSRLHSVANLHRVSVPRYSKRERRCGWFTRLGAGSRVLLSIDQWPPVYMLSHPQQLPVSR